MDYPGNLFVVAAPSGAGKSSLVKALMELDGRVQPSVSHTTRAPRGQEKHGREYFFVSEQEFDGMVLSSAFVEWAHVHGNRYGTSKKAIEDRIATGADVILEIDFQGAIQIRKAFANAVLIFILPPSWEELRSRLERMYAGSGDQHALQVRVILDQLPGVSVAVLNQSSAAAGSRVLTQWLRLFLLAGLMTPAMWPDAPSTKVLSLLPVSTSVLLNAACQGTMWSSREP